MRGPTAKGRGAATRPRAGASAAGGGRPECARHVRAQQARPRPLARVLRPLGGVPWGPAWGCGAHLDEVGLDEAADEDTVELEVAEPPAAPAMCESRPARAIALQGGVNPDAKRESAAADRWSAAAGCLERGRCRGTRRCERVEAEQKARPRATLVARATRTLSLEGGQHLDHQAAPRDSNASLTASREAVDSRPWSRGA